MIIGNVSYSPSFAVLLHARVADLLNTLANLPIHQTVGTSHGGGIALPCYVLKIEDLCPFPRRPPSKDATVGPLFLLVILASVWFALPVKRSAVF
jgi:hypothetical protein